MKINCNLIKVLPFIFFLNACSPSTPLDITYSRDNASYTKAFYQDSKTDNLEDRILHENLSLQSYLSEIELMNKNGQKITVDLRKNTIPYPLSKSKNAHKYFIQTSDKRLDELGLLYDFNPYKMSFYLSIPESNSEINLDDIISRKFAIKRNTQNKTESITQVQKKLKLEGFFKGEINGNVSVSFINAVKQYQEFHGLSSDGVVGKNTAKEMTRSYTELSQREFDRFRNFLTDRVFHSTYVLNSDDLNSIVDDVIDDLDIETPRKLVNYLSSYPRNARANIEIPENYLVDNMKLRIDVKKYKNNKSRAKLTLTQDYNGKEMELLNTRVILGGVGYNYKTEKYQKFFTPNGNFNIKRVVSNPRWNPPSWSKEISESATETGPLNAFGLYMAELYNRAGSDSRFRIHSTTNTQAFKSDKGSSHGCVRINPPVANYMFPFIIHHLSDGEIQYNSWRGDINSLERSIPVKIR